METTSYPTMEYSLSDIQLPDPPKEKDKINVTVNKTSKGVSSSNKSEKNHTSKNEGQITSNNIKEESNNSAKKVCEPSSPQPCVTSDDSKKDNSESGKNVSDELKISSKEVNKHKSKETSPVVDKSSEATEINSKTSVIKEAAISEDNGDTVNDTKQSETKVDSKKSTHSSSSTSSSKTKEQRSKTKKDSSAVQGSKEKDAHDSQNATRDDSAADEDSAKIVRKRKNRRTSRSSSRSSSSESSSSDSSSPQRESSHSKRSGKSGSSSEGIASPSSSGSSSGSDTEEEKKSPPKEKLKVGKTNSAENFEGGVRQRRKINRSLSIKGFQENSVTKDTESEEAQEPSATSHKVKKEDTEKNETVKKADVREIKFTPRKLSLTSLKTSEKLEGQGSEKSNSKLGGKKRKWGNCTAALPKASVSISSDSLKTLIPDLKPFTVAPVLSDQDDLSNPVDMESPPKKETKIVNLPGHEDMVVEEVSTHSQMDKTSNVIDTKDVPNESVHVSPAHNPMSNIIFIKNLVRPFTLLQLKELLKQTGKMVDEHFWIDKIKSKCIVTYETEEQAVATRTALHGTRWPLSNPKILSVDFSTEEELDAHRNMTEFSKPAKVTQHVSIEKQEMKEAQTVDIPKRKNREEHRRDKDRQKLPITHVREWDKDKLTQDSPDQPSHRIEKDAEKSRSDKRKEKKDSKRRVDDDAPAKLLDDLFRKTRASPCIYWLPLTEEQAKQREEERQARRLEREKRWQQRKEQEESERRNRTKGHSGREKESRRSQSRSRSPLGRRR